MKVTSDHLEILRDEFNRRASETQTAVANSKQADENARIARQNEDEARARFDKVLVLWFNGREMDELLAGYIAQL